MVIERQNTIVITFIERDTPRPNAYDIHEWIHNTLKILPEDIAALQLNGITRQVYIKCKAQAIVEKILLDTNGESYYIHEGGQRTKVTIDSAGLGIRYVKVYNLPTEVPNHNIKVSLETFGNVVEINEDVWSGNFRYSVPNGVRTVKIALKKHIPSYQDIAGHRALITYTGQPVTCALCSLTGHLRADCPTKKRLIPSTPDAPVWTALVQNKLIQPRVPCNLTENVNPPPERTIDTTQTTSNNIPIASVPEPEENKNSKHTRPTVFENKDNTDDSNMTPPSPSLLEIPNELKNVSIGETRTSINKSCLMLSFRCSVYLLTYNRVMTRQRDSVQLK